VEYIILGLLCGDSWDELMVLPECRPTVSCYVYYGELFIGVTSLDGGLGYLPSLKLAHVYQFGNLFT